LRLFILSYKQLYDAGKEPVEGAYEDSNADGIINANDKYIYKNPDPKAVLVCIYLKLQES
jgi:iron complex outermembrane receptor protein